MITVGIKVLNQEDRIAAALEHALRAVAPFGGKVVLADSGSTDRTVEIASRFPVRVVQLANTAERCCGAGAQLAFQHADTEFFYLQDGDMTLHAPFLHAAMAYLRAHPGVAGVGGHVVERVIASEEFRIRVMAHHAEPHRQPGIVDRLDGGGLYRVEAIRQVGYFADRNLHGFEEFDLAARLHAGGWQLARIDMDAVDHYGHAMGGYRLMWRRFRSRYGWGGGEIVRAALGQKHLRFVLGRLRHLLHGAAVVAWWLALCAAALLAPPVFLALLAGPVLFLWLRRRSPALAVYSFLYWNICAIGLVAGLMRRRRSPTDPLESVILSTGCTHPASTS